jgi:hypothetical protein
MDDGRSMRAVKGNLGHSARARCRGLGGAHSTRVLEDRPGYLLKEVRDWEEACSEGQAGEGVRGKVKPDPESLR